METAWEKGYTNKWQIFYRSSEVDMCMSCIYLKPVFLCKHLVNSVEKADAMFFKKVRNNLFLILFVFI